MNILLDFVKRQRGQVPKGRLVFVLRCQEEPRVRLQYADR